MAQVNFFGYIGPNEAIQALPKIAEMKAAENTGEDIDLYMSCGGGSVIEAIAIVNHILESKSTYNCKIVGIAASMGSQIASACDNIQIAENAYFHMHLPFGAAFGEATDIRSIADLLDSMTDDAIKVYMRHSNVEQSKIVELLKKPGTIMSSEEAVEMGFCHEVILPLDGQAAASVSQNALDLMNAENPEISKHFELINKQNKQQKPTIKIFNGAALAAVINGSIDDMETEERSRADIIQEMASAAGIEAGTVNDILNGDINCPPIGRLEGFARVLTIGLSTMTSAAERDGCVYGEEGHLLFCTNKNLKLYKPTKIEKETSTMPEITLKEQFNKFEKEFGKEDAGMLISAGFEDMDSAKAVHGMLKEKNEQILELKEKTTAFETEITDLKEKNEVLAKGGKPSGNGEDDNDDPIDIMALHKALTTGENAMNSVEAYAQLEKEHKEEYNKQIKGKE